MTHYCHLVTSVRIGRGRHYSHPSGREVFTACEKKALAGKVGINALGVAGDAQVDRKGHGGADRALLVYALDHYSAWERELGRVWLPGSFGENLTVTGLEESSVCVGDRYSLGDCLLEVSYPRQPCSTLARFLDQPDIERRILANFRSGWFLRVLREGEIEAGLPMTLDARPYPAWDLRRVSQLMYHSPENLADARQLAAIPALAWSWRKKFIARAGSAELQQS